MRGSFFPTFKKRCFAYTKPLFPQVPPSVRKSRNWTQRLDFWARFCDENADVGGIGRRQGGVDMAWTWRGHGVDMAWIWRGHGVDVAWTWCVGDVPKMAHFVTKMACLIAKMYDFKEMFSRRRSSQMIACYVADDFNK